MLTLVALLIMTEEKKTNQPQAISRHWRGAAVPLRPALLTSRPPCSGAIANSLRAAAEADLQDVLPGP